MINDREQQKALSRKKDLDALKSGKISQEELRKENGFFSALPLHEFRISKIGNRKIEDFK